MFKIDSDLAIHLNRGDGGTLSVSANNGTYEFEDGDKVKFNIYDKNGYDKSPLYSKEVTVQGIIKTYDDSGTITGTYKQLDYIEGHDSYIDTNLTCQNTLYDIEIVAEFDKKAYSGLVGYDFTTSSNDWFIYYDKLNDAVHYNLPSSKYVLDMPYTAGFNKYKLSYNNNTEKFSMYRNSTQVLTASASLSNINKNLYIGAINVESSTMSSNLNGFTGKIQSVLIKGNGADTIFRKYVPAKNLSNDKIGLLDIKNGVFYSSADTDHEFTAPPGTYDAYHVNIPLDEATTEFVPEINKKKTYWYDITLNEDATIIGYENADGIHPGAKLFNVYPAKTSFDE